MTSGMQLGPPSAWRHWYRQALPAFWIYLFCITHFPKLRIDVGFHSIDKLLHVAFFGLLAFLFWRFAETFRKPSPRLAWLALAWIGAYAAADEWLQGYVGRSADIVDWTADMIGVAAMLGVLEWRRRVNMRAAGAAAQDQMDSRAQVR